MVRNRVAEYIDYGVVGASALSAALAVVGGLYAFPWSRCTPKHGVSKEYNSLWGVRVSMQLTAALWLLSPVLQLHETWSPYIPVLDALNWSPSVLCRIYLAGRLGWFEPFFLLTSLLTFKHSLRRHNITKFWGKHHNRRIIWLAFLHTLPILGLQVLSSLATLIFGDVEDDTSLPEFFISTYTTQDYKCDGGTAKDEEERCILCVFSLLSTILCSLFMMYYLWRMWQVTMEMARITLNHNLEQRIHAFRMAVTMLLLLGTLCRGLTVFSEPKEVLFELLRLGDFVSIVLVVAAASAMLVLRPVRDARMADKLFTLSGEISVFAPPPTEMVPLVA